MGSGGNDFGGDQTVGPGPTRLRNPLITTHGADPHSDLARQIGIDLDAVYKELQGSVNERDATHLLEDIDRLGGDSRVFMQALDRYAGNANMLLQAATENVIWTRARAAGHDSIMIFQPRLDKSGRFDLTEIGDFREVINPTTARRGGYAIRDEYALARRIPNLPADPVRAPALPPPPDAMPSDVAARIDAVWRERNEFGMPTGDLNWAMQSWNRHPDDDPLRSKAIAVLERATGISDPSEAAALVRTRIAERDRANQWAGVPFDPASAAAGGAAGAMSEGEDGEQGDPLRTFGGMAVAGILGNVSPRAAARWRQATQRAAAQAAAARAAGKAPPPTAGDWLRSIGYSGMIGPSTGIVNAVGNGMELLYHLPKDFARSVARGNTGESWAEAKGLLTGLTRAGGEMLDALAGAHPGGGVENARLSQRVQNPIGQVLANLIEAPTRVFSEVPDAFYRSIATSMGESRRAAQIATDEGLRGAQWSQRVNQLLADVAAHRNGGASSPEVVSIIKDGVQLSERLTLRGDVGPRGEAVKKAFDALPFGVGNLLMPFFNTPYQMLQRGLERSPAGLRMGTQPARFDKYYDAILGSGIGLGVVGLATGGLVSGSGPDDAEKKAMLRSQGWQANSTLVGGVWVPNNAFGVFGPMLDIAGEIGDGMRYQKADNPNLGEDLAKRMLRVVKNQVYLRGLSDLIKATEDPGSFGASYAANVAGRLIPGGATARTVGNMTDPYERQVDSSKDVGYPEAIRQRVARGLPNSGLPVDGVPLPIIGGREDLPPAQDVLGRPQENERSGAAAFGPKTRTPKPDATIQAFTDAGVDIGFPPDAITIDGIKLELTPAEQREWQRLRGAMLEKYAGNLREKPWWNRPEARTKAMQELLREANAAAGGSLQRSIGAAELRRRLRESAQKKAS